MVGFIIDNVGLGELLLIALVALIVFGPEKTPELARKAGKAARKIKKMTNEFKREFEAMVDMDEEPVRKPVKTAAPDPEMLKEIVKSKTAISTPPMSAAPIVPRAEKGMEPESSSESANGPDQ